MAMSRVTGAILILTNDLWCHSGAVQEIARATNKRVTTDGVIKLSTK